VNITIVIIASANCQANFKLQESIFFKKQTHSSLISCNLTLRGAVLFKYIIIATYYEVRFSARKSLRVWKHMKHKCMLQTTENVPWSNRKITVSITKLKRFENIFFSWGSSLINSIGVRNESGRNEATRGSRISGNSHWNSAWSLSRCFWNCMNNKYQRSLNQEVQCKRGYRLCFIHFRNNDNSLTITSDW
jgi:hypothetical protein